MNTFKGMVSRIMQKWYDHSSGNSWLHFELFLARYCEFKDRKGLYSSSEAQTLQVCFCIDNFLSILQRGNQKPLLPFTEGDCCSKADACK